MSEAFGLFVLSLLASTADVDAVYTGPEGLLLTGVGRYDGPNRHVFAAPLDRNMHWSSPGYDTSAGIGFAVLTQPASKFGGRHGVVFHDACWSLLEEASHPRLVSLQRLLDVCRSLPLSQKCRALSWGHNFGRATIVGNVHHFPWERCENRYSGVRDTSERKPLPSRNPHPALEVHDMLAGDPDPVQPPTCSQEAVPSSQTSRVDYIPLPEELFTTIAMYLPTADVLRARLAWRAFWPVFFNQQFWKSRFRTSAERSWLFEVRNSPPEDWRWLYRRTNDAHIGPGLRNRQRIWGVLQGVLDILALAWNELPPALPALWSLDPALCATDHRVEAAGDLWSDGESDGRKFHNGCRRFRTQSIAVPETLARLSVYTLAFGDGEYIVGMSLTAAAGDTIRLGYRSPTEHSAELSQIWGFRLAIGSRGLQALQCITGPTDSETAWLGSPVDIPRTERLVAIERVLGLELGFDVSALQYCACG